MDMINLSFYIAWELGPPTPEWDASPLQGHTCHFAGFL